MSSLEHKITLTVGDWSGDGHSQSEDILIHSNLTQKELEKAFKDGSKKLKFKLEEYCRSYEDNILPEEVVAALKLHGLTEDMVTDLDVEGGDEDDYWLLGPDGFADIWLFIAKLGNDKFEYEFVEKGATVHVGGYGLFS